ncbi:hypothetical protein ACFC18_26100 [Streptomyces sp. NPDC056121]
MYVQSARHLRIAAHIELISLIVMLANVFTAQGGLFQPWAV